MASKRRFLVVAALAGALSGCSHRTMFDPDQKQPTDAGLVTLLHTADPQAARQLVDGFYGPEAFGRWTKPKFSMVLAVPHAPALQDPKLLVKLFIPDNEMAQLKSLSLSSSVNGVALGPETFTTPGAQLYVRSLSAQMAAGNQVQVDFALDKWMPGTPQDSRALGIVVTVAGLKSGVSAGL